MPVQNTGRRFFLLGAGASAVSTLPLAKSLANSAPPATLLAKPQTVALFGDQGPSTEVWSYGGGVPGPVLKVKQGERVAVTLQNELPEQTTVHWHGLRLENAMDGVPYLTQPPILPGKRFNYEFTAKDAGTFWYHPHVNSAEQVGRGLAGAFVVEEPDAPPADRDLVWVLDDWRLQKDGLIVPFGNFRDATHAGRLGNVATVNGMSDYIFRPRSGERIRLRLINAANARIFALDFEGHDPWLVAVDGHPVVPSRTKPGLVTVPPGGRADIMLDISGKPGEKFRIVDRYYRRGAYVFADIHYGPERPIRSAPPAAPAPIRANPVAKPDTAGAEFFEMVFQGGAMGGLREAEFKGVQTALRELAAMGMVWAVNGAVIPSITPDDVGKPMISMKLGRSYVLRWRNDTACDHPIHVHGHCFHVIARNGQRIDQPIIMDTVLIRPDEFVDVAFVADNPGRWALHCHVLEHAQAGMMGFVEVE